MKILHVTKKYPPDLGGDAVVVANLEKQQKNLGLDVLILTHHCHDVLNKQNIAQFGLNLPSSDLDRVSIKRLFSLLELPFFGYWYLRKNRPDIIHTHSLDLGFAISLPARVFGIPVLNTCHGVSLTDKDLPFFKKYAEIFFLKHSGFARIITVDNRALPSLRQQGISNVEYIPNGVDLDFWGNTQTLCREKKMKTAFLFVGRLEEQKGLIYLINAVRKLKFGGVECNVRIVGDGSQRSRLEKLADTYGLGSNVIFTGRVDQKRLKALYTNSDVFILPSLWEGMPLTLLEAWAAGLPVIVTKVGNIPEICVNRENAWIVEPGNETELYNAMLELSKSAELRHRLGRNGGITVRRNYSWSTVARRMMQLYKEVCVVER